jgi:hypothetical protein
VVVPSCGVVSGKAVEVLLTFARAGGAVTVVGEGPRRGAGRNGVELGSRTRELMGLPNVKRAESISAERVLGKDAGALRDVRLQPACRGIKYVRRSLDDGELYFLHNETESDWEGEIWVRGQGKVQKWDPLTAGIEWAGGAVDEEPGVRFPLRMEGWESCVLVLSRGGGRPGGAAKHRPLPAGTGREIPVVGDWDMRRRDSGEERTAPLSLWQDLGWGDYSGSVHYRKEIELPSDLAGRSLWLDLGTVRYSAEVWMNGRPCGRCAWRPYRVDISGAADAGRNRMEIRVTNTDANAVFGNPERVESLKTAGLLEGSYFRNYESFDREQLPSGLLGPVRIRVG